MDDPSKVQQHLTLLREQYVKLQEKCLMLEQKLALVSAKDTTGDDTYVSRLMKFVASLHNSKEYSDMTIKLIDGQVNAHKFVFDARGGNWGLSLKESNVIDWSCFDTGVGSSLLQWIYTDQILLEDYQLALKILRAASQFKLWSLVERCEETLIGSVTVKNCVQLFSTAEEIGAESLKKHCSTLISTHWNDFTPEDFAHMSAPFLYDMFKSKTKYCLHAAVRLQREDVLFLYLIEFNSQLPRLLDQPDDTGKLALDLALEGKSTSIAKTLIKHEASVNATNASGISLIHSACYRGDVFAVTFLLDHQCNLTVQDLENLRQPLHVVSYSEYSDEDAMCDLAGRMIGNGSSVNAQDKFLQTPLHLCILSKKKKLFDTLLNQSSIELNLRDIHEKTPLWYALTITEDFDDSFATKLADKGASLDLKLKSGDTMLHVLIKEKHEKAAIFVASRGGSLTTVNARGETPLHLSCTIGLPNLTAVLLKMGADPNCRTTPVSPTHLVHDDSNPETLYRETPLHRAVRHENIEDVREILKSIDNSRNKLIIDLEDSEGLTPLGCALINGSINIAQILQDNGANVNHLSPEGLSLLHRSILQRNFSMANFVLSHKADPNVTTREGASPIQLCIEHGIQDVLESLCENGADLSACSPSWPEPPLWMALDRQYEDIASILVSHGVDVDGWSEGDSGCEQTFLHRAIDENREDIACFLIRSGCDPNATPREGFGGRGRDIVADNQTPLHMCCSWGLLNTAKELVSFGAKLNAKDGDGKTCFHIALENSHQDLINLLLEQPTLDLDVCDSKGKNSFAVAMSTKNNKAAQAILNRFPPAAEQYDTRGQTFLHVAIQKRDLESVLFLLSVHVNLTCITHDDRSYSPLHLATVEGDEMIVRNLLLAGADIHQLTPQKDTCLHLAAQNDHAHLIGIFIENGINCDALDTNLNNALHVAIKEGHLSCVKALLTESQIDAGAFNLRGQNPLHVLATYPKDNAAAIAQLFLEALPDYPINTPDVEGNTALLLAYIRGAGQLCRVLVMAGSCLGSPNKQGIHLFNYEVASKTLLGRLLDCIASEPPWSDGDCCLECGCRFSLANRKHHCRHCGRLLCSKCSGKDVPIIKFHINKPVRVCQICFDVITMGASAL